MSTMVNLDEVGRLTRSGRGYQATAEDNVTSARGHLSRMEGAEAGFTGAAGAAFQSIALTTAGNHGQIARQIAEQARRAVEAERLAVVGDEQAFELQASTRSAAEALTSVVSRRVNV
ncbi:hypothetical protein FE697_019005 [Mumia zhuanghuii]|uniref:Uncharacterized protein n=2 Tax=Mumia TaxID=1546255 RepID=A0ABW1QKC6_9ACTN|nr:MULTISPECIES: hypothetical protein [Mumia]KAA1419980.1 hypothetical protein FE697_019005 [Mumia zhuanghuii]